MPTQRETIPRKVRQRITKRINKAKEKYDGDVNLPNMIRRIELDPLYHEIKIRYQGHIVCFYCGQMATGVDHQPPISRVDEYKALCKKLTKEFFLVKVSCCAECNRLLGNSLFSNFEAKLNNLRERLKRKYRHLAPDDKIGQGRLRRRLVFNRGLNRVKGRYE